MSADLMKSMKTILEDIRSPESVDTDNVTELNKKIKAKAGNKDENENDDAFDMNEDVFEIFEFNEDFSPDQLDEDAGNLKGLPSHIIKHITNKHNQVRAGKDSEIEKHAPKSLSALHSHIRDGMDKGHAVAIHVNGKLHKVVTPHSSSLSSRQEYHVHDDEGMNKETMSKHVRVPNRAKAYDSGLRHVTKSSFNKSDAVIKATAGINDKEFVKNNKVEVHHIAPDKKRAEIADARAKRKPEYDYYSNKTQKGGLRTVGDRLAGIKDSAAEKIARKKLAGGEGAREEAKKLHDELGKHIAAGNHREVRDALHRLSSHIQNKGLESQEDKVGQYKNELKNLRNSYPGGTSHGWAKERLAKLRGETNEDVESLIDSIMNEDAVAVENLLDKVMACKLDESISMLKESIAQSFFEGEDNHG